MQISRHLLLACAVTTCLTPNLLRAYDNEAQIRARQALEEKMKQLDTQPAQTSTPPAVVTNAAPAKVKKAKAKPAPAPAPVPEAAAPVAPATPVAPEISHPATPSAPAVSSSNANNDKLREALREKMDAMKTAPAQPVPPPAPVKPAPAPVAPPPAPAVVAAPPAAPVAPPPPAVKPAPPAAPVVSAPTYGAAPAMSSDSNDKLQQALREKMSQTQETQTAPVTTSQPAPAPAPAPTKSTATPPAPAVYGNVPATTTPSQDLSSALPKPATNSSSVPVTSLQPLSGPASPLSAAKQQKLDELLQMYRADRLTPQQYHEQRAKILSEQ